MGPYPSDSLAALVSSVLVFRRAADLSTRLIDPALNVLVGDGLLPVGIHALIRLQLRPMGGQVENLDPEVVPKVQA
jgi:hypothetical protein